jgi:hypothetical protein
MIGRLVSVPLAISNGNVFKAKLLTTNASYSWSTTSSRGVAGRKNDVKYDGYAFLARREEAAGASAC